MKYYTVKMFFEYDFLEPFIDSETMKLHYEKHHIGYCTKLNNAINDKKELDKFLTIEDLMKNYQSIKDNELKVKIREFGGGLINHNFLWAILKKDVEFKDSELKDKIINTWESVDKFKEEFKNEALNLFGSGWVWLIKKSNGELKIIKTFNQDNPWFLKLKPLIGIDLWEHAYYLKHNSNRANYFDNFWNVINWEEVLKKYSE